MGFDENYISINDSHSLRPKIVKMLAVLGFTKQCLAHGGGSASVNAHYKVPPYEASPYEALDNAFGTGTELLYPEDAHIQHTLPIHLKHILGLHGYASAKYSRLPLGSTSKFKNRLSVEKRF